MRVGIFLSYQGLGANLLHLAYCHEIAKKYGPISLVTICKNLKEVLGQDKLVSKNGFLGRMINDKRLSSFISLFSFKIALFLPFIWIT